MSRTAFYRLWLEAFGYIRLCMGNLQIIFVFAMMVWVQPLRAQTQAAPSVEDAKQKIATGHANTGIDELRALAAATPAVPGAAHALGVALYRDGKLVEAAKVFTIAEAQDPADIESIQLHGLTMYRLGQPAAAIPYLKQVSRWMPSANADANYVLGLCYLNVRKYDEARAAFAADYKVAPDSAQAYLLMAQQLLRANLPELAGEAAQEALKRDAQLPLAHFTVGEVALFKSDAAKALTEFEAERRLNPAFPKVYERLGDLYIRTGKYEQAQEILMQALSLDTTSTGPFLLMGKVLERRSDPQSALLYLQHAVKMDPSSVTAHTLLGQAYRELGDEAKAKAEAELVAHLNSGNQLKLDTLK